MCYLSFFLVLLSCLLYTESFSLRNQIRLNRWTLNSSKFLANEDYISHVKQHLKKPIFLVGMMGSGKTTVGKELAKTLGFKFVDTDAVATTKINTSISSYFECGRESDFRLVETQILQNFSNETNTIVSTGGGIVVREENRNIMRKGLMVYLNVPPTVIYNRLTANVEEISRRPLLRSTNPEDAQSSFVGIFNKRKELYEQAQIILDLSDQNITISETVERLLKMIFEYNTDQTSQYL